MRFSNGLIYWFRGFAATILMAGFALYASAAVEELADEDLSVVSGREGITISFSLQWNPNRTEIDLSSKVSIGFEDKTAGLKTFLVMTGFGGGIEFWGPKIDARTGPADVGDYIELTMPAYVGFSNFGAQAVSVQNNDKIAPTTSYGQWYLNGSATVTGSVYMWPAK